jgi:hypothetical protein
MRRHSVVVVAVWLSSLVAAADSNLYVSDVNEANPGGKDLIMRFEELERGERTSTAKLTFTSGASVASAMFIQRGFYEIAKGRGAKFYITLREWDADDGTRMYLIGFSDSDAVDPKAYFGLSESLPDEPRYHLSSVEDLEWFYEGRMPPPEKAEVPDTISYYLERGCSVNAHLVRRDGKTIFDGAFTISAPEGDTVVTGRLANGDLDGEFLVFRKTGELSSRSTYSAGIEVGERIYWDAEGRLLRITRFGLDGRKDRTEQIFAGGSISLEIDWEHHEPVEIREYVNGQLAKTLRGSDVQTWIENRRAAIAAEKKAAQPGATDNPDGAQ